MSINYLAHETFEIYRVKSICLPFVHTIDSQKKIRVFDLRRTNLFRLSREFAAVYKKTVKQAKKKSKCSKSKQKAKKKGK